MVFVAINTCNAVLLDRSSDVRLGFEEHLKSISAVFADRFKPEIKLDPHHTTVTLGLFDKSITPVIWLLLQ
jgi:hypothetical protein